LNHSFSKPDFRNLKGQIAEKLVKSYIEHVLIPALQKEWDIVIFTPHAWFGDEVEENKNRPEYLRIFWQHEEKFFIANKLFPTQVFLNRFKRLTKLLENVPDGFIIKMKNTGKFKCLKEALNEFNLSYGWEDNGYAFNQSEHKDNELLTIVEGDIEIVEVKCDKSNIPPHQKKSYRNVITGGYALRFLHVDLCLFTRNEFEIDEKLITDPDDVITFPIKTKQ